MLGRRTYTREELDAARSWVADRVARFRALPADDARAQFGPAYAGDLLIALDRRFVHRLRAVTGREGTPLDEPELVAGALVDGGVLRAGTVICYRPEQSVEGLAVDEPVRLTVDDAERLALAALDELETAFVA